MKRGIFALGAILLAILLPILSYSQAPVANFSLNKTSGCPPIVVQFTDQSTNTPTSWHWDLGNGGSSTLQNPSATYILPGTYTVILTATNANGSSKDTNYITVYAAPTVAFTANDSSTGCGTKTVTFNNQSVPGGNPVTYLWDFGDGDSSTAANPVHTYTQTGIFTVSLIVSNGNGCTGSLTKNNYIKVVSGPTTNFGSANANSCSVPYTVNFTDSSSSGAVTYAWDFGDGNTSTSKNPSHTYTVAGSYNVRLIATDSNGCSDTLTKASFVNVGQVNSSFSVSPSTICSGQQVSFTNTTTPGPGTSKWYFGDGDSMSSTNATHAYASAGNYTVTLIEQYSNCSDTATKNITVKASPVADFTTNDTVGCKTPFSATFTNTSTGATSYAWSFGDGNTSTSTSPGHSYTSLGYYNVQLIATSTNGCKDTMLKTNKVKVANTVSQVAVSLTSGCAPATIYFTATMDTPQTVTNYKWDFGDGSGVVSCSACSAQSHLYNSTGVYNVVVILTSASGCTDTVNKTITINSKPTAAFSGTPLIVCPMGNVTFTNSSTGATSYLWDFDDGSTDTATNPVHGFPTTGKYTIRLIANNMGCTDTATKVDYIEVQPPEARFTDSSICDGSLQRTFVDGSISANTYSWNFGDGNTSTTAGTVTHTYATTGTYIVQLTVTNTTAGCSHTYSDSIVIDSLIAPDFVANDTGICKGETVTFSSLSSYKNGISYSYDWGTGSTPAPSVNTSVKFNTPGTYTIKFFATDSKGCKDSLVKTNYLKVGGPTANFVSTPDSGCGSLTVLFHDISTVPSGFSIVKRNWLFSDGSSYIFTNRDTITKTFTPTSSTAYWARLYITDQLNCVTLYNPGNVAFVQVPDPDFNTTDTVVCIGDTVSFSNTSGGSLSSDTYLWDFGDGNTATSFDAKHVYSASGSYTVKLKVISTLGCSDSIVKTAYVKVEKANPAFAMSDTFAACPPLTVYFTNNTPNLASSIWTFGNNSQSSFTDPSTTYTYPGTYTVKLIATSNTGCTDSTTKTVQVNGPTGSWSYSPLSGCSPMTVNFTATSSNTTTYIWDMNNGVTQNTSTGSFSYTYTQSGIFVPKLILSDGASCLVPLQVTDTVIVDDVEGDFSYTSSGNMCNTDTVHFTDTTLVVYTSVAGRLWDFGDGGTSTAHNPSHYYNAPGTYQVQLIFITANGCLDTVTKSIVIHQLPTVNASVTPDSLCQGALTGVPMMATGADTFAWTPATGLSCTNCANPTALPTTTTTYTVTGTDTNGCADTAQATVKVNPKPVLAKSNDTSICEGASASLLVSGAVTYSWSPSTGLSCTNCANPTATPATTTMYTVIGANTSGCTDTATITVTVLTKPVINTGNKTVCYGDTATLTVTGASTYIWSPISTLTCSACDSTRAYPLTNTTYTVIGTAANGCKDTASALVTITTLPSVSAGNDTSICINSSISLQATGANTYTWTPSTGLSCTNCANPIASPTTTTTYTVTGVAGVGCSDTGDIKITVNPLPTISAGTDQTICEGFSVSLQATGGVAYTWSPSTGLSCTNCANPAASPTITTTYIVTGTDANGCMNTDTVVVNVNPRPNVNAGNDTAICSGTGIQLLATGASTYVWSPSTGLSCTNCANPTVNITTTATYSVIGMDTNGCKDTANKKITINPLPTISAGNDKEVCLGSNIQLQATGGVSYTWSPSTGLSCTNCSNPVASPTTTTTYTITGTDANGCTNTGQIKVTVNPLPTINAGSDKTICAGLSTTLQATGGVSYTWTPSTGLSCTNCANPTASPVTTTTYVVTGTDAKTCTNTDTVEVKVNPQPNVSAGNDTTLCAATSLQLQATGASTYIWSPPTGLSCTNCANPTVSVSTTVTYTVIGTDANGCKDTATKKITINPLPTISAGPDKEICTGSNVQLQATGGTSYIWSPSTGLSCTSCSNPVASPTTTTTYTITGTDANGCTNTGQIKVTVNPLPNISAGSDQSVCLGDSVQLQATGGTSYTWSPSTGLGCTNCANPKASPATTTTYTVTGTDSKGCVNTATVKVTVKPLPTISAGSDKAVCLGDSVQLQATGGISYTWSPTASLSCTSCPDPKASPLFTVAYIVTGTAANGCKNTDTVEVKVNPLPIINAGADQDLCLGDTLQLQASGGATYTWSPGTGLSCTSCPNPKASPSVTTTYRVIGVDTNGCTNNDSVTITIKPLPVVTASAARTTICIDDTTQLQASGATTYTWSPSTGLSCVVCSNPVATPQGTSNTYIVTGTQNGCSDTASVTINTLLKPAIFAGPATDLCKGESDTLHASGGVSYSWTPSTGLSCTNCDSPVASPLSTTTYKVEGTDSKGCKSTGKVTVTVHDQPAVDAGKDVTICDGKTVQLRAMGADTFRWSPPTALSCTNCPDPVSSTKEDITYKVIGSNSFGCIDSSEVSVTVIKKMPVKYSPDDTICEGETIQLFAEGGTAYSWSPTGSIAGPQNPIVNATPDITTLYSVIIKQGDCFTDTGHIKVTVVDLPTVDAGQDQTVSGGLEVTLETSGTNIATYEWSPPEGLSCTDCANPKASPKKTTKYNLKVYSDFGCTAEDNVTVYVTCGGDQLFVANTFTPNGDGVNDRFFPQGRGLDVVKRFSIYSRWGELLYDVKDIPINDATYGWDGTYKNEQLKPDVFVYIIRAVCETGEPIEIKGDISLIR